MFAQVLTRFKSLLADKAESQQRWVRIIRTEKTLRQFVSSRCEDSNKKE